MITDKLQFYKDCDIILREHRKYHFGDELRPVSSDIHLTFKETCIKCLNRSDMDYIYSIFYKLNSENLIENATFYKNPVDDVFFTNSLLRPYAYYFLQTTSFEEEYIKSEANKTTQSQLNKSVVNSGKAAKSSSWASWFSGATAAISLYFGALQYDKSLQKDKDIESIQKKLSELELHVQSKYQQSIHEQKKFPQDSLPIRKVQKSF